MTLYKRMITVAGSLAAATTLLSSATPAQAGTSQADVVGCTGAYPSSLSVWIDYRYNYCGGRPIRVKAVVDWGPDSSCRTLEWGAGFRHQWWTGSFSHVAAC
ncbi:hypothetical protein [Nonomuraea sp. B1E8]|uniref:hypothetical protein n=1 Tax=unclassified Nonomuraea TaxID=2593643 RepID=UPI00325F13E8